MGTVARCLLIIAAFVAVTLCALPGAEAHPIEMEKSRSERLEASFSALALRAWHHSQSESPSCAHLSGTLLERPLFIGSHSNLDDDKNSGASRGARLFKSILRFGLKAYTGHYTSRGLMAVAISVRDRAYRGKLLSFIMKFVPPPNPARPVLALASLTKRADGEEPLPVTPMVALPKKGVALGVRGTF